MPVAMLAAPTLWVEEAAARVEVEIIRGVEVGVVDALTAMLELGVAVMELTRTRVLVMVVVDTEVVFSAAAS